MMTDFETVQEKICRIFNDLVPNVTFNSELGAYYCGQYIEEISKLIIAEEREAMAVWIEKELEEVYGESVFANFVRNGDYHEQA
jgi:hypothetical protein